MSPLDTLILDLKRVAKPEIPGDRKLALTAIAAMGQVPERKHGLAKVSLVRAARALGLGLRAGVPPELEGAIAKAMGEIATLLDRMPDNYRPPTEDVRRGVPPEFKHYYLDKD